MNRLSLISTTGIELSRTRQELLFNHDSVFGLVNVNITQDFFTFVTLTLKPDILTVKYLGITAMLIIVKIFAECAIPLMEHSEWYCLGLLVCGSF